MRVHTVFVDTAWERVESEVKRQYKGDAPLQWLADRLGYTIQRVQNWKSRGIPRDAWYDIAVGLGVSIDWIAGLVDEPKAILGVREPPASYGWPFAVTFQRFRSIPDDDQRRVGAYLQATVEACEAHTFPRNGTS